ncbi:hypothetical protein AGR56_16600 [Clostridium sp. DMHC 10]|uniref:folate family ECF transporter S component n=1 Tax=Clostridium sp. DMHC 10 TaxID=747377 RepID=UPI00069CCC05|nr:folate family ECF transporter S component [Clostridium sp. DMHC 10]KOF57826.1 hypothetical protein AGR56_16600 [Clostridium sp. DMHC 10]
MEKPALSIFTLKYWVTSSSELKKLRTLTFAGITIALSIVLNSFYIPVGENLHISFVFLVLSLGALIFGPVTGLFVGAIYDILGFVIHPSGTFFPGYTLSTMLEFFIYGLFLYRSRITILRVFLAKFIVNYGIHVGLGCLWSKFLFNKGYLYFFTTSIIKNTIMLPIEVILLVLLLQLLIPALTHMGIVQKQNSRHIPFI